MSEEGQVLAGILLLSLVTVGTAGSGALTASADEGRGIPARSPLLRRSRNVVVEQGRGHFPHVVGEPGGAHRPRMEFTSIRRPSA